MLEDNKTGALYKVWKILMPLVVFYTVYLTAVLLLSWLVQMAAGASGSGAGAGIFREAQRASLKGIVNGIGMLAGAMILVPVLREELRHRQQLVGIVSYGSEGERYTAQSSRTGRMKQAAHTPRTEAAVLLTVLLAVSSSIGLNILLTLTGFSESSDTYQDVAQSQYGVAVGLGLILYVVISPVAEEIVFRGIIYNRMRRYFNEWRGQKNESPGTAIFGAIVASGVLFGIYHGNLVQGIYGACMGILMAYVYERMHAFYIPCLFHAAANCVVYLTAQGAALQERIYTVPCCVVLIVVSAAAIFMIEKCT